MDRTYPYQGWVLTASFSPKEVTFVQSVGTAYYRDETSTGKVYLRESIFRTPEAAISAGWDRINKAEADLARRRATLDRKRAVLTKAAEQLKKDQ